MGLIPFLALALVTAAQSGDFDARVRAAAALERGGNLEAALDEYRALVDAAPEPTQRGEMLIALALVHNRRGEYVEAHRRADEAALTFRKLQNSAREAGALNVVGLAALYSGDYRRAQSVFETATHLAAGAADAAGHAELLSNLGNAFFFQGRYDDAAGAYVAAIRVVQQHVGAPWVPRRERIVRLNQAALYQRLGRYQTALQLYRADASDARLRPDEHAQALVNQGALYRRLGDPLKALAAYEAAQQMFARARHADGELGAQINRGIVYALDLENLEAARQVFAEARDRALASGSRRQWLQAELYRAEAEFRAGRFDVAQRGFETSANAAAQLSTPEESWKALYGLARIAKRQGDAGKASQLLEKAIGTIEGLREDLRLGTARADFFQEKREVYDALIDIRLDAGNVEELFLLMERARAGAWRDRVGLPAAMSLAQVQQRLDDNVLLLEYWSSPAGLAVIAVRRESAEVRRLANGDEATAAALSQTFATPGSDWQSAALALSAMLLPPGGIEPSIERVIIVPDGLLSLVPFDVLNVNGEPLIRQAAVTETPTAATLVAPTAAAGGLRPPWHPVLAVFADPLYGRSSGGDDDLELPPLLPASAREASAIASELAGRVRMFVGRDNVKSHFIARPVFNGQVPTVIHVASHALVQAPLERSHILFSGPEHRERPDPLFLREIYDLDLRGVQLAVLSACDTERGELVRGEGVQSFSRALLAAGAASTVTTLWKVPDEAPVNFMRVFYHRLQQGDARDEALRQAKLAYLASGDARSHPHYWAAYVLTGASGPIRRAIPWSHLTAAALGLLALVAFVIAVRR